MKRPPFKVDGRVGHLRWVDAEGRPRSQSGRLSYLYGRVYAQAVIAGTGREFAIRLGPAAEGRPWHRIEATPDELRPLLTGLSGPGMIRRAEATRAARVAAGLPVVVA